MFEFRIIKVLVLFSFIAGSLIGSFLAALTYRLPRSESIADGRSRCPKCKSQILWYDNIPAISYLLLQGRCRKCKKPISKRYPLIELATAVLFTIAVLRMPLVLEQYNWLTPLGVMVYPFIFLIISLLIAVFVIDLEHQIIPDEIVLVMCVAILGVLIGQDYQHLYTHLLSGLVVANLLLLIHLLTLGRGMGLGDVKLALAIGMLLGFPLTVAWLMGSFMLGGAVGLILLLSKKAELKDKVAFGPFLVVACIIILFVKI